MYVEIFHRTENHMQFWGGRKCARFTDRKLLHISFPFPTLTTFRIDLAILEISNAFMPLVSVPCVLSDIDTVAAEVVELLLNGISWGF